MRNTHEDTKTAIWKGDPCEPPEPLSPLTLGLSPKLSCLQLDVAARVHGCRTVIFDLNRLSQDCAERDSRREYLALAAATHERGMRLLVRDDRGPQCPCRDAPCQAGMRRPTTL